MSTALTLYEAEENLLALVNTDEGALTPEQAAELLRDLADANETAVRKRDNCIRFRQQIEGTIMLCEAEIERMEKYLQSLKAALKRFDSYLMYTMDQAEKKELLGTVGALRIVENPPKVNILNEQAIPEAYKRVTTVTTVNPDKEAIKKAIQNGEIVRGADLSYSSRLEIK